MNSFVRIARSSAIVAKRANVARTFVSTPKVCGAAAKPDAHGHGDHGHDEHEHHDHPMWENLPFNKGSTALWVFGLAFTAVGAIVLACEHQQKKQGYKK